MIDKKDFSRIKKELDTFDSERENLIKISRDILRLAKHSIFSIHNNELKEAEKQLKEAEKLIAKTAKVCKFNSKFDSVGAISSAMQEYVEAKCYYSFVNEKKIPSQNDLNVCVEDYLLGLCDLTGELGRRAVIMVINEKSDEVYLIKEVVEEIFGLFLGLNFRNGELRKKSDSIKWNLKKIEEIIYDLKTRGITNNFTTN